MGYIPNHANSSEHFWDDLKARNRNTSLLTVMINEVQVLNTSEKQWDPIYVTRQSEADTTLKIFRL